MSLWKVSDDGHLFINEEFLQQLAFRHEQARRPKSGAENLAGKSQIRRPGVFGGIYNDGLKIL